MHARSTRGIADAGVAYGKYASRYDDLLRENRINAYMRQETTHALLRIFGPGDRVLELGSGTGDEALTLADRGCEVVGLDPAPEMVRIATEKAAAAGLSARARFHVGPSREAATLLAPASPRRFEGAYSHFALSYEPDLGPVREAVASLLVPGGHLLVASMNRYCAAEWVVAAAVLSPHLAGRRLREGTTHKVGDVDARIFPRSASELAAGFTPDFVLEDVRALPALLPPHYANRVLRRWPGLVDVAMRFDPAVSRRRPFRALGDHVLARFRRTV
jgi:SAM-dependent methyltransferase